MSNYMHSNYFDVSFESEISKANNLERKGDLLGSEDPTG